MLNILLYTSLLSLMVQQPGSLNFIGYNKKDIKENMRKLKSDFYFNKEFETSEAKIIKYTDLIETKTLLYVLDENENCRYYLIMYDLSYYNLILKELNSNYKQLSDNKWIEEIDGKIFTKSISKNEWYFTVITKKNEK
ncbi:MAG: hypothetical protein JXB17_02075 [Bacteroidales bacterium]|nr:hypothetical protein [Bacteroidales bacterium]